MTNVSISEMKINPAKVLASADDYPIAIEKRNKIQAYIIGKNLYDKLIAYIENYIDIKAVKNTNFKKGADFDKVTTDLGI